MNFKGIIVEKTVVKEGKGSKDGLRLFTSTLDLDAALNLLLPCQKQ